MMQFAPVPGPGGRLELAGSDNYFVGALAPADSDQDLLPDMHVGRIPVGTVAEARAVIDKILAYESYGPDDAWRNRGLIVSDDL
jgi:hypothetical protein